MIALLNVDGLWLMAIVSRCGCWMLNKTTRDDSPLILSIACIWISNEKKNVNVRIYCVRVPVTRHAFYEGKKWFWAKMEVISGLNVFMHLALDFAISFHSICFLSCRSFWWFCEGTKCLMNFHCVTIWECHGMCDFLFGIRHSTLHGTITHHTFSPPLPPSLLYHSMFFRTYFMASLTWDNTQLYYK